MTARIDENRIVVDSVPFRTREGGEEERFAIILPHPTGSDGLARSVGRWKERRGADMACAELKHWLREIGVV